MILALIVTHNRLSDLKICIKCIKNQKLPPDQILIINNGSTDGTLNYLKISNLNYINSKNLGSAGGWNIGIQYAIDNNFKYIWMMDDDGYPHMNALYTLNKNFNSEFSCVSSLILDSKNQNKLAIPLPKLNKNNNPILFKINRKIRKINELNQINNFYNFANFFNGALIRISAIKKIGNININFFLYGEEVDYFHRLRKVGKVVTNINAYHFHPSINKKWTHIKIYYYLRNSIYLNYKYYDYPFLRSIFNILAIIFRVIKNNGLFFFIKLFKPKDLKKYIKAIKKGFNLEIGNDSI